VERLAVRDDVNMMIDPGEVESRYRDFVDSNPQFRDDIILDRPFPFELFGVDKLWNPTSIRLLLLGESPPSWNYPTNYFYNADYCGNLSNAVFDLFHISGAHKKDQLMSFKEERGYLLIDTLLCAYKDKIPRKLVYFSGEKLLKDEVLRLRPASILVLGNNALRGLKRFEPFSTCLERIESVVRKKRDGKWDPLISKKCGDVNVVASPFPNHFRNKVLWWQVEEAFCEASRIAGQVGQSTEELNSQ
jgi:hypothetical protein